MTSQEAVTFETFERVVEGLCIAVVCFQIQEHCLAGHCQNPNRHNHDLQVGSLGVLGNILAIGVFYRRRMLLSGENHDDVFVVVDDDDDGKVIPFCCVNHSRSDSQEGALSTG